MLAGKTVIQRVNEQVTKVIPNAYVATDDERNIMLSKALEVMP
jgi:CMP-2-keto-3-deoxyoctulosonic acid synthetase